MIKKVVSLVLGLVLVLSVSVSLADTTKVIIPKKAFFNSFTTRTNEKK